MAQTHAASSSGRRKDKRASTATPGAAGGGSHRGHAGGGAAAAAAPPPTLLRICTADELQTRVCAHAGAALLAVVTPLCTVCTDTIVPYLEKLNAERPTALQSTHLAVLYAGDDTRDLCALLHVVALPCFFAYSHGRLLERFAGDNVDKVLLLAKLAAQAAQEDEAAAAAAARQAAAATPTAADDTA